MKNKYFIIIVSLIIVFIVLLFKVQADQSSITTVKYFPYDKERQFIDTETNIRLEDNSLIWTVASKSDLPMYLRHDIGLIYENGYFKGVQSKWKENAIQINISQSIPLSRSSMYKAISYHHGEIHQNETITSIQKMSAADLLLKKNNQTYTQIPMEHINTKQAVAEFPNDKWDEQIIRHNINKKNYTLIPLTELVKYEEEPLPGYNQEKSKEIIGKLWEGIYKNYVLRLKEKENQLEPHPMPFILLSKEQTHLYVLFELNQHPEILIQQIN